MQGSMQGRRLCASVTSDCDKSMIGREASDMSPWFVQNAFSNTAVNLMWLERSASETSIQPRCFLVSAGARSVLLAQVCLPAAALPNYKCMHSWQVRDGLDLTASKVGQPAEWDSCQKSRSNSTHVPYYSCIWSCDQLVANSMPAARAHCSKCSNQRSAACL